MIVGARLKAKFREAVTIGWSVSKLTGHKPLSLAELIDPKPRLPGSGNARALEMFRRAAAKQAQGNQDGTG